MTNWHHWIEAASVGIELLAVAVMLGFTVVGTVRWLLQMRGGAKAAYEGYRVMLGRSLLLGLELLVAADIVRTVTIELTIDNLLALGLLVIVRTALGWTLAVEIEGHWPWQAGKAAAGQAGHDDA